MEDRELRERLSRIEEKLGIEPMGSQRERQPIPAEGEQVTQDRIGQLLLQIYERKQTSKDPVFTSYLETMENNLVRERMKLEDMAENLEQNYAIYLKKQAKEAAMSMERQSQAQPVMQPQPVMQAQPVMQPQPMMQSQAETRVQLEPQKQTWQQDLPHGQPQSSTQPQVSSRPQPTGKAKPDMEFRFGAVALSVIGALFIIAAFVTFGLNFMDSLAQGILLYVLAVVILVPSELLLRKNLPRFAQAVTGIGICTLYTATILNYLYLHTINAVLAIVITVAVSVFALFLSRKRDSATLRLIGILGCYISMMPLDGFESQMNFVIPCIILVIVNVIYLLLRLEKKNVAVPIVHSLANLAVTFCLTITAMDSGISAIPVYIFALVMTVSIYAIYYRVELAKSAALAFYVFVHIMLTVLLAYTASNENLAIGGTISFAAALAVAFYFYRKKTGRWTGLYCLTGYVFLVFIGETDFQYLLAVSLMLALYKVLSFREDLKYGDMIVSAASAIVFICHAQSSTYMQYVLLGVFVLSVIMLRYNKTYHEILLLGLLEFFAIICFDDVISIPLAFAFVLFCLFLFGKVERYKGKKFRGFVIVTVVMNAILLLGILFLENPLSLTIVLVLEIAYLMLLLTPANCPSEKLCAKGKPFAISLFLTYMIFAYDIRTPIVVSILLMLLAIGSVGAGFLLRQKNVRIYGLVLSLFVCAKIMLVDFADTPSADKVILFFVVGILALAISYLYMRIERSLERSGEKPL